MYNKVNKPNGILIDSKSNQHVVKVTKYICKDTGKEIDPNDLK